MRISRASVDPRRCAQSIALRPRLSRIVWIGAGVNEQPDDIRVTEDNREDEGGLAAARRFIYVRAIGQ